MKLTSTPTWTGLLLATALVPDIFVIALPKTENALSRRDLTAVGVRFGGDVFRRTSDEQSTDHTLDDASLLEESKLEANGKNTKTLLNDIKPEDESAVLEEEKKKPLNEDEAQDETTDLSNEQDKKPLNTEEVQDETSDLTEEKKDEEPLDEKEVTDETTDLGEEKAEENPINENELTDESSVLSEEKTDEKPLDEDETKDETTDLNEEKAEEKPSDKDELTDETTNLDEENATTSEETETADEGSLDDKQNEELTSDKTAKKGGAKPKFQVHPETHITAVDAAKGGKVDKSGQETFGTAKPAKKKTDSELGPDDPCYMYPEETELIFVNTVTANVITGDLHDVSEALCPPGSISHSYSFTTTWSLSGQVGPDLKDLIPKSAPLGKNLDKFGIRFGVQYSWSNSQTTTYGASETSGQNHPFVLTYRPRVMCQGRYPDLSLTIPGQKTTYVHPFKERIDCVVEHPAQVEMHIPIHTNDDCANKKTACGPAVAWDHCFFLGSFAKDTCPDRNLGPTPERGRQCPVYFYPPQYQDGHGGIKG